MLSPRTDEALLTALRGLIKLYGIELNGMPNNPRGSLSIGKGHVSVHASTMIVVVALDFGLACHCKRSVVTDVHYYGNSSLQYDARNSYYFF